MKNEKILEMINNNEIEQLKALIQEEIYKTNLTDSNAKKRYSAMKNFYKYSEKNRNNICSLPCKDIDINGIKYTSFTDGYCIVCTSESINDMETFDTSKANYMNVSNFFDFSNAQSKDIINITELMATAKSNGYKLKTSECDTSGKAKFLVKYKDAYFKLGLLDKVYSIINDGNKADMYYNGARGLIQIKTSIGFAGVLPMCNVKKTSDLQILEIA